jgi:hypothetical protein
MRLSEARNIAVRLVWLYPDILLEKPSETAKGFSKYSQTSIRDLKQGSLEHEEQVPPIRLWSSVVDFNRIRLWNISISVSETTEELRLTNLHL